MVKNAVSILRILIITYVVTAVMLLLMSFGMYKLSIGENLIKIGIVVVYALSCAIGGFICGKNKKQRRLLWGLCIGICYFAILSLISFIVNKGFYSDINEAIKAAGVCLLGGIIGGVIS